MNWRGLDELDQAWIAAAGSTKDSRAKLAERGELELHKGYLRRQRRRDSYFVLAIMPLLIGLMVLILAGALPDSYLSLPLFLIGLTPGLVLRVRDHRAKTRYRSAQERSPSVSHMTYRQRTHRVTSP